MKVPTAAQLREQTGLGLVLLARFYRYELDAALKQHGLSEANSLPLRFLGHQPGGMRQGALAHALHLEGPSLIRVLEQLIKMGYVARQDDPEDGRVKIVTLTDAGRELNRRLGHELDRLRRRLFEGVDAADLQACIRTFDRITANMQRAAGDGAEG